MSDFHSEFFFGCKVRLKRILKGEKSSKMVIQSSKSDILDDVRCDFAKKNYVCRN